MERKSKFIKGIYNYCDRWCERCFVTEKCRLYANLKDEGMLDKDVDMQTILKQVKNNYALIAKMIDKGTKKFGIDLNSIDENAESIYLYTDEEVDNHELSIISRQYYKDLDKWFENAGDKIMENPEEAIAPEVLEDSDASFEVIKDAFEVIRYYMFQIHVKIKRALSGMEKNPDPEMSDYPDDATGSAHVALTGIEHSIAAWETFKKSLLVFEIEAIKNINCLLELKQKIDIIFPGAKNFKSMYV